MRFRVTTHHAVTPPKDALTLLGERIPARRDDVVFSTTGGEIIARLDRDEDTWSMTRDEQIEVGREAVLEVVEEICERSPDLKLDWFAVSPVG